MIYHLLLTPEYIGNSVTPRWICGAAEYNGLGWHSATRLGAVRNFLAMVRDCPEPEAHREPDPDDVEWCNAAVERMGDRWFLVTGSFRMRMVEPAPLRPDGTTEFCE